MFYFYFFHTFNARTLKLNIVFILMRMLSVKYV